MVYDKEKMDNEIIKFIRENTEGLNVQMTVDDLIEDMDGVENAQQAWYHIGRLEGMQRIRVKFYEDSPKYSEITLLEE